MQHWLQPEEELPHLGNQPTLGYMNSYEWVENDYLPRRPLEKGNLPAEPCAFTEAFTPEEWRDILLECMRSDDATDAQDNELANSMERESTAAMCDGINTGFYINAYTTKQLPDLQGTLEELRKGIQRLELRREETQEATKKSQSDDAEGSAASEAPRRGGPNKFGQVLQTLNTMSSAFKRCHHRSMSEILMPIMFHTMTYFSHRCWKVFIKRAVFLAAQTWRNKFGQAVRHKHIKDGGGVGLRYLTKDKQSYPLVGWERVCLDGGAELYRHPDGTEFGDLQSAYDYDVAVKSQNSSGSYKDERKVALTALQRFLNEAEAETTEDKDSEGARRTRTTTPVDDWLHRGDHPVLKDMPLYIYAMWVYSAEKPPFQGRDLGNRGKGGGEQEEKQGEGRIGEGGHRGPFSGKGGGGERRTRWRGKKRRRRARRRKRLAWGIHVREGRGSARVCEGGLSVGTALPLLAMPPRHREEAQGH